MTHRRLTDPKGEAAELLLDLRSLWHRAQDYHLVWIVAVVAIVAALLGGI